MQPETPWTRRIVERGLRTLADVEELASAAAYDCGEKLITEETYRRVFALAERVFDSGHLEPRAVAELERAVMQADT